MTRPSFEKYADVTFGVSGIVLELTIFVKMVALLKRLGPFFELSYAVMLKQPTGPLIMKLELSELNSDTVRGTI